MSCAGCGYPEQTIPRGCVELLKRLHNRPFLLQGWHVNLEVEDVGKQRFALIVAIFVWLVACGPDFSDTVA